MFSVPLVFIVVMIVTTSVAVAAGKLIAHVRTMRFEREAEKQ